jgi:hypothetical protein
LPVDCGIIHRVVHEWRPGARLRGDLVIALTTLAASGLYLAAPVLGTDLSAQVARATFFAEHGATPLDFGWYGGISPYGYSLLTPPLMSWLGPDDAGPRLAGAGALVVSAFCLAALLRRTGAHRPVLGGMLSVACLGGNLVSGRVTYAIGVAFGLIALAALTADRRSWRRPVAATAALLAAAASPVAALFVGLAGVALAFAAYLPRRDSPVRPRVDRGQVADGVVLATAAGVPLVATAVLFGAGGWMNLSLLDAVRAGVASLVVALLVPCRPIRIGALLATVGVAAAFAVHTPVGLNATRLAAMFAIPVLAAYARTPALPTQMAGRISRHFDAFKANKIVKGPGRYRKTDPSGSRGTEAVGAPGGDRWRTGVVLATVLVAVAVCQPPVSVPDLRSAGDPTASRGYFQPLLDELASLPPARVEVVPTRNYWEAAYVPEAAPLARGWLRQADQAHHRLFLDGSVDADSYRGWLRENGVGYVALAAAEPSWVGRREAELIRAGQPYLTPVWSNPDWTLYEVAGLPAIVDPPTTLVSYTAAELIVGVPAGDNLIRIRWSRWLRVTGPDGGPPDEAACLAKSGDWTALRVSRPGHYTITGGLTTATPC